MTLPERVQAVRERVRAYAGLEPEQQLEPAAVRDDDGLVAVVRAFGLTPFERDVLALVAGCELDPGLRALCAAAGGDGAWPSFGLALGALEAPHWDALSPEQPLRGLALLHVERRGGGLLEARLTLDERVLLALLGLDVADPELQDVAAAETPSAAPLPERHGALVAATASRWLAGDVTPLLLWGDETDRRAFERALAVRAGAPRLWRVDAAVVAADPGRAGVVLRRLAREARLTGAPIVLELEETDPERLAWTRRWAHRLAAAAPRVVLASRDPVAGLPAAAAIVDLPVATLAETAAVWRAELGPPGAALNGEVERLAGQFRLGADQVRAVASDGGDLKTLWGACRRRARADLDGLAERIEPSARWHDLVLPERELVVLRALLRHARHRARVYEDWLVTGSSRRGTGVSALFAGPSGTGKSLAAEVIAGELDVDLYRIDLSQVISKYIGETEKHLRRVFDAAERSGAVLVVDEADALFGRRSEVKDSHDRYANIEVGYLLQRIESYRGVAVLTTNLRKSIDDAFIRRLAFIVTFPFPDAPQRRDLWQRAFGPRMRVDGLDPDRLAQLILSGGSIRNVAVHAAFLAAERSAAVTMGDILDGARAEYDKLDRPLTGTELAGWAQ